MGFVAIHHDDGLTLATDGCVIPPSQVQACDDAVALARSLRTLRDAEAERIAAAARAAHAEGRALGRLQGRHEAHAEAAQQLADTLAEWSAAQQRQQRELREAVVALALLTVRRVASTLAREAVLGALLVDAVERMFADEEAGRGAAPRTVRLHPRMLGAVRAGFESRAPDLAVDWRADDSLGPLDIEIETSVGRVLAGLDAQLERIRELLCDWPQDAAAAQLPLARAES